MLLPIGTHKTWKCSGRKDDYIENAILDSSGPKHTLLSLTNLSFTPADDVTGMQEFSLKFEVSKREIHSKLQLLMNYFKAEQLLHTQDSMSWWIRLWQLASQCRSLKNRYVSGSTCSIPNSLNFSGHLDIYHVEVWCENADIIFGQLLVIDMFESSFDQIVFSINCFFPEKNVPRTTIMISQSAHLIFFVFREKLVGVVLHRLVFRPYSLPSWKMIFSVNFFVKWQQNVKLSVSKSVLTENVNFWKERSFANWGHLK